MNEKWVDRGPYSKIMAGVAPETPAFVDFGEWEPVGAKDFLPAVANAAVKQLAYCLDVAVRAWRRETTKTKDEIESVESLEPMTVDASLLPDFGVVGDIVISPRTKKAVAGALVLSQLALASCGPSEISTVPRSDVSLQESVQTQQVETEPEPLPTYTVQPKDTCSSIARKFGVNVNDLMVLNGITEESARYLQIDTVLKIPAAEAAVVEAAPAPPPPTPLSPQSSPDAQRQPLSALPEKSESNLVQIGNFGDVPMWVKSSEYSTEEINIIRSAFSQATTFIGERLFSKGYIPQDRQGIIIEPPLPEWKGIGAGYHPAGARGDQWGRIYIKGEQYYKKYWPWLLPEKAMASDLAHEELHALGIVHEDPICSSITEETMVYFRVGTPGYYKFLREKYGDEILGGITQKLVAKAREEGRLATTHFVFFLSKDGFDPYGGFRSSKSVYVDGAGRVVYPYPLGVLKLRQIIEDRGDSFDFANLPRLSIDSLPDDIKRFYYETGPELLGDPLYCDAERCIFENASLKRTPGRIELEPLALEIYVP